MVTFYSNMPTHHYQITQFSYKYKCCGRNDRRTIFQISKMLSSKVCFYYYHRQLLLWSRLSKLYTFVAWIILSFAFLTIESYAIETTVAISKQHFFAQKVVNIGRLEFANSSPKISVILPAYNVVGHGKFERAVNSILQQTFVDFELLLVDDGSIDNTKALIRKISIKDKRVVGVYLKTNGGLPNALNAGLNRSKAALVTWTSSDNFLEPNFLE